MIYKEVEGVLIVFTLTTGVTGFEEPLCEQFCINEHMLTLMI